jgi:hypothetical protein
LSADIKEVLTWFHVGDLLCRYLWVEWGSDEEGDQMVCWLSKSGALLRDTRFWPPNNFKSTSA